jgi:hypothetical protein
MTSRGSLTVWAGLSVMAVGLVVALFQGLTIQEVGIPGIASIKFGETQTRGDTDSPRSDGSTSSADSTVESNSTGAAVVDGSWIGTRGGVSVEVTRVENQSGHLRIDAAVTNDTGDAVTIPLFGNAAAVDESGRAYEASAFDSDWPQSVASGQTVRGTIEFEGRYESGRGGTLDLTFATLFGFDAPRGSLSIEGIERP